MPEMASVPVDEAHHVGDIKWAWARLVHVMWPERGGIGGEPELQTVQALVAPIVPEQATPCGDKEVRGDREAKGRKLGWPASRDAAYARAYAR